MGIGLRLFLTSLMLSPHISYLLADADPQPFIQTAANPQPSIEPGVCTLGKTLECKNDGKSVGMFDVSVIPQATTQVGSSIAIANKKDPKKRVYLGYQSGNRQSQIFQGPASVACYACSGSGAQDPNMRTNPCLEKGSSNYCVECDPKPVDCRDVLTIQRVQSKGAEGRAASPGSLVSRLGLTEHIVHAKKIQ